MNFVRKLFSIFARREERPTEILPFHMLEPVHGLPQPHTVTGRPVIACNFLEATEAVTLGSAAYVARLNGGQDNDAIEVLVRSRSGAWIKKWERIWRLGCFRAKVLSPEDPRFSDKRLMDQDASPEMAHRLMETSMRWREKKGLPNIDPEELQQLRRPASPPLADPVSS